jgi:hypothetical protein
MKWIRTREGERNESLSALSSSEDEARKRRFAKQTMNPTLSDMKRSFKGKALAVL